MKLTSISKLSLLAAGVAVPLAPLVAQDATQEAEAVIPASATFASNTSTLPITGLAKASARPDQFIGLHFFSPVDKMKLVEIIVGKETSDETLAKAFDYSADMPDLLPLIIDRLV